MAWPIFLNAKKPAPYNNAPRKPAPGRILEEARQKIGEVHKKALGKVGHAVI